MSQVPETVSQYYPATQFVQEPPSNKVFQTSPEVGQDSSWHELALVHFMQLAYLHGSHKAFALSPKKPGPQSVTQDLS